MIELLEHGADPHVIMRPHTEFTPMKLDHTQKQDPDKWPIFPPNPMTIEQVLHHVLPTEKEQVLQVLQQKRAEKAKLRFTARTNTDPEVRPMASLVN